MVALHLPRVVEAEAGGTVSLPSLCRHPCLPRPKHLHQCVPRCSASKCSSAPDGWVQSLPLFLCMFCFCEFCKSICSYVCPDVSHCSSSAYDSSTVYPLYSSTSGVDIPFLNNCLRSQDLPRTRTSVLRLAYSLSLPNCQPPTRFFSLLCFLSSRATRFPTESSLLNKPLLLQEVGPL